MKKIVSIGLALCLVLISCTACGGKSEGKYAGQKLHLYTWGAYTGENTIQDFEALTGCEVVVDEFESNEQMYIKVANGDSFDILIPSDYMIERLLQEDLLQPLDHSKITCLDKLTEGVKNLPFDPNNDYSVPYLWGNVGIVYDKTKVSEEDLKKENFGIFLDQKYKGDIYLYDSERDMFMAALKQLGYSMNTGDEKELNEAYEFLLEIVNTMEPEIVTDEIIDNMAQLRKAFGLVYSGDATYILSENENAGFYVPECGTNIWCDSMVIPKNAENPELAHEFINFITDHDAALDTTLTVGYTSPNDEVMQEVSAEGGEYDGIATYIPRIGNSKDEVYGYDAQTRLILAELWSKVKIAASNAE